MSNLKVVLSRWSFGQQRECICNHVCSSACTRSSFHFLCCKVVSQLVAMSQYCSGELVKSFTLCTLIYMTMRAGWLHTLQMRAVYIQGIWIYCRLHLRLMQMKWKVQGERIVLWRQLHGWMEFPPLSQAFTAGVNQQLVVANSTSQLCSQKTRCALHLYHHINQSINLGGSHGLSHNDI